MNKKRSRPTSSGSVRVQKSYSGGQSSAQPTQINTHVHVAIDSTPRNVLQTRLSVRKAHVIRPAEIVDLSNLLAPDEEGPNNIMVDEEIDALPHDMSDLPFGLDDDEVEDSDAEGEGEQENTEAAEQEPVR